MWRHVPGNSCLRFLRDLSKQLEGHVTFGQPQSQVPTEVALGRYLLPVIFINLTNSFYNRGFVIPQQSVSSKLMTDIQRELNASMHFVQHHLADFDTIHTTTQFCEFHVFATH